MVDLQLDGVNITTQRSTVTQKRPRFLWDCSWNGCYGKAISLFFLGCFQPLTTSKLLYCDCWFGIITKTMRIIWIIRMVALRLRINWYGLILWIARIENPRLRTTCYYKKKLWCNKVSLRNKSVSLKALVFEWSYWIQALAVVLSTPRVMTIILRRPSIDREPCIRHVLHPLWKCYPIV